MLRYSFLVITPHRKWNSTWHPLRIFKYRKIKVIIVIKAIHLTTETMLAHESTKTTWIYTDSDADKTQPSQTLKLCQQIAWQLGDIDWQRTATMFRFRYGDICRQFLMFKPWSESTKQNKFVFRYTFYRTLPLEALIHFQSCHVCSY